MDNYEESASYDRPHDTHVSEASKITIDLVQDLPLSSTSSPELASESLSGFEGELSPSIRLWTTSNYEEQQLVMSSQPMSPLIQATMTDSTFSNEELDDRSMKHMIKTSPFREGEQSRLTTPRRQMSTRFHITTSGSIEKLPALRGS
jgi:hypothetical protein